jgi:hypothetical protein
MVKITHNIRLRGSVYGIHMGPTKGIQMIPHGRNLIMSCYGRERLNARECHAEWLASGYYRATNQVGSANIRVDSDVTHAYL